MTHKFHDANIKVNETLLKKIKKNIESEIIF